jgi:hypothetical protein
MSESYPHPIDPAEIVGPMRQHRDALLAAAEEEASAAEQARISAKTAAERVLDEGEKVAEHHERLAAKKRATAAEWDGVIAREQAARGSAIITGVDGWQAR